jgi:2-hydroxychromene-2-carboxylate isomerase
MAKETKQEVKVYDLSRIADRVRAIKRGVMRTPTLIMGEKRYQGFEEISRATARKLSP